MDGVEPVRAGTEAELHGAGRLLTKVGRVPVVVFWCAGDGEGTPGQAYAIEDRCPHLGFPLHRGTVESGLVTCHWHHARFDLCSGCTLDPWADDAEGFAVDVRDGEVWVSPRRARDDVGHRLTRLREGLEEGIDLVLAKAVLGLLDAGVAPAEIVGSAVGFGAAYRRAGWGTGLTTVVALANVLDRLGPDDRAAALVHALHAVAADTAGQPPRFGVAALPTDGIPANRLAAWYRRFVDTRSGDAAERVLHTALAAGVGLDSVERMMTAAATDHVFLDGGHTIDFTNKAFEALDHLGSAAAASVLPALVPPTVTARRSEETGVWRHPVDLVGLAARAGAALPRALAAGAARRGALDDAAVAALGRSLLGEDPAAAVDGLVDALARGATEEQVGRAVALAAALRIVAFHVQNDHGDWNAVHHAFTAANAVHASLVRAPGPEALRAVVHGALRVHLDRFLNVPPARPPTADHGDLADLARCWEVQGCVDEAGAAAYGHLRAGGARAGLVAALGHALVGEDARFHWYQLFEAAVRQAHHWPDGSEESALILAAFARFLAAHTPTRRELPSVIRTAVRLHRGDALHVAG